jgi:hypothetical protein
MTECTGKPDAVQFHTGRDLFFAFKIVNQEETNSISAAA